MKLPIVFMPCSCFSVIFVKGNMITLFTLVMKSGLTLNFFLNDV
jgi:hypothetical protein